jgi:glycosyltransferase involved in cell wall biosynthesis
MASRRVLFVLTPALDPNAGGVQMTTCKLARRFRASGHDVGVFSFERDGHQANEDVTLFVAGGTGGARSRANLGDLKRTTERFQPDVVINQMPYEHEISDVLARDKSYALLGCLRNTLYSVKGDLDGHAERALPGRLSPLFKNRLGRRVLLERHRRRHRHDLLRILASHDRFVMFGPPNLDELAYFVPDFDRARIELIPNSIPQVADRVPDKDKRVLWLGRVDRAQKRAELILDTWRQVAAQLDDWSLDVVGDGPALEELRAEASATGVPRIAFHGKQKADPWYRRAAVFFMTSAFEGFPNTLIEAQSFGAVPVIFDSYPVASWLVRDGVNGALVASFDTAAMARKIVWAAAPERRPELAEEALVSARQFHIDVVGEQWDALFDRLLGAGQTPVPEVSRAA